MEHVSIDDVEPSAMTEADRRGLSDPLSTSDLAINHYRLEPGERLSGGPHTHMDQVEVFVVLDGAATFERPDGEDDVTVDAGEAVRFAPGEYQSGVNDGDGELRVLALGVPRDSEAVRVPGTCPECGHEGLGIRPSEDGEGFDTVCPECGTAVAGD